MNRLIVTLGALVLAAGAAFAQGNGQDQGGGVRTPDMDPSKKGQIDPVKEFPTINKQADSVTKATSSYTAKFATHEVNMTAGLDARTAGTVKAKRLKGDMWALLEDAGSADKKLPAAKVQVVNKKVLSVWPEAKEYERVDYTKKKESYAPQIFFGTLYQPAKFGEDFELKIVRLALKYKAGDGAKEKPPVDDPFANKASDFEKDKPNPDSGGASSGPDPQVHHVIELTPKDKKLKERMPTITLWVHYQNYAIAQIEIKYSSDGSNTLTIAVSEIKIGADVAEKDIQLDVKDLKERAKK